MLESNSNGGACFKRSKPSPTPLTVPAGHVAFRLICHASRVGGVIGKSGAIIKQLQYTTNAKIRVEEPPDGSDDRVIVIIASSVVNRKITLNGLNEDGEEIGVSSAQEALVRVFERILDVAAESDGLSAVTGGVVSCRLLTEANQAGSVIGKGGKVIENIRKDSGCKIRILNADKFPSCALPTEEMVEVEGNIQGIKKALVAVSRCLQDCSPLDRTRATMDSVPQDPVPDPPDMVHPPPPAPLRGSARQPLPAGGTNTCPSGFRHPLEVDNRVAPMDFRPLPPLPQQEVVFRMLCSTDRVGGLIGKGGSIIRAIQSETGASVVISNSIAECVERLITISCMENLDSQYSPAQRAAALVFNRCLEAGIENGVDLGSSGSPISARLVVSSDQVGCLLGKGGSIVSEMRRQTRTSIWIIGGDQVPMCCPQNNEVVQITGEFVNVRDALHRVTSRLRENLFPSKITESSANKYNSRNHHTNLTKSMDNLGLSNNLDYPSSQRMWLPQKPGGRLHPRSGPDVGRGTNYVKNSTELGSGNRPAIVTNTTVEIVVPENAIGCVYGDNGSNLTRLRQISGAKVVMHEPRPGTSDGMVVISGTPDETQAAQSLLHAFILSASSS